MTAYLVKDDHGDEIEIEAATAEEAAQEYADGGDWPPSSKTWWLDVRVTPVDDPDAYECVKVTVDPEEPDCPESDSGYHDWQSPVGIVGGIADNPGCWAKGGAVICVECCMKCGAKKTTDHWAQDPEDGAQGLVSIEYVADYYLEELEEFEYRRKGDR